MSTAPLSDAPRQPSERGAIDADVRSAHLGGKIEVSARTPVRDAGDLARVYTPGVAQVSRAIAVDPLAADDLTIKRNSVAVVTDGSAVLGLGDVGPLAALPVMEGKAMLLRELAGVDAYPICLDERDPDRLVDLVAALSTGFGGINLEDIAAPRCFEVEGKLRRRLDIPVFHDDQHGTAVVVLAALRNAVKVVGKRVDASLRVVVQGIGAAGIAITNLLLEAGVVAPDAIVFAMANPVPEIDPVRARERAAVVATGRSDHPNQINNVLCFPGLFRGLLDARATPIDVPMKLGAAEATADIVGDDLDAEQIPAALDPRVVPAVAEAVRRTAAATGAARTR